MALLHMAPARTIDNTADVATIESERCGNVCRGVTSGSSGTDHADKIISEDGQGMSLAFLTAMALQIRSILGFGAPVQILKPIVRGYAIAVAGFMGGRAWTNEGFKHQMSHKSTMTFKRDKCSEVAWCLLIFGEARLQLSPACTRSPAIVFAAPRTAIGADTVIRIARYGLKEYLHMSILSHMVQWGKTLLLRKEVLEWVCI